VWVKAARSLFGFHTQRQGAPFSCQPKTLPLGSRYEFSQLHTFHKKEIEQLREAWKSLNDLLKNITNAEACLLNHDLKLTADHLKVA
jgi:hypothetical protein